MYVQSLFILSIVLNVQRVSMTPSKGNINISDSVKMLCLPCGILKFKICPFFDLSCNIYINSFDHIKSTQIFC